MRSLKQLFSLIIFLLWLPTLALAEAPAENSLYFDSTHLVVQQVQLLKNRLAQANNELADLQHQQERQLSTLSIDSVTKQSLNEAALNIAIAQSNLDSINIELSESKQAMNRLDKDIQETEDQVNVFSVFGLKIARTELTNVHTLQDDLVYQKDLRALEKTRNEYLLKLRDIANNSLQLHKDKYVHINILLKSRKILQLKAKQARSEMFFQQQQSFWLQKLNTLYGELNRLEKAKSKDASAYTRLEGEIFFANENVNFTYLQMLIARYHDQILQLKITVARNNSITILNKAGGQILTLGKQLVRVNDLLKTRMNILEKRSDLLGQLHQQKGMDVNLHELTLLQDHYKSAVITVTKLNQALLNFRGALDKTLEKELSARQGFPGFSAKAWLNLGGEIMLVPTLTFQIIKSVVYGLSNQMTNASFTWWSVLILFELSWIAFFYILDKFLIRRISSMAEHESGHINLKRLMINIFDHSLWDIAVIGGLTGLFLLCGLPYQNFDSLVHLGLVWLIFKWVITAARICLVETVHHRAGHDVRLYRRLKMTFLIGGMVTALTVFIAQLPVVYELKAICDRLFLLFLLVVSILLLRSWELVPALILPHIDAKRLYLQRVVRLLGFLIPLILLTNSVIGLSGFVNLVLTVSWYESIFVLMLVGYLLIRGLCSDGLMAISNLLIGHFSNGWLWTEAFLKPLDKIVRIIIFISAWGFLFLIYGWDKHSPVVTRLTSLLHYHLIDVLNTSITPLAIFEVFAIISFLYWAARWTREFVYRLLSTRIPDMALRNTIAIFSQYSMIIIGIFICLRVLGIDLKALGFVATAFAFGVGLGLRDLANNFACGFLLLIERPLRVGDTVSINTFEGEVTHIGSRAVTVRTWDHMDVLVPNTEIFNKSFTNWTAKDNIVRTLISIKINRHDQPHKIQAIIANVLSNQKDVLKDPGTEVFLKELNDTVAEFEVRYYVNLRQVKSRVGVRSDVLVAIWEAFENNGIKPAYPLHEVRLHEGFSVEAVRQPESLEPPLTLSTLPR